MAFLRKRASLEESESDWLTGDKEVTELQGQEVSVRGWHYLLLIG